MVRELQPPTAEYLKTDMVLSAVILSLSLEPIF